MTDVVSFIVTGIVFISFFLPSLLLFYLIDMERKAHEMLIKKIDAIMKKQIDSHPGEMTKE